MAERDLAKVETGVRFPLTASLTMKRLYRNKENRVFAGIIGGLGEYFEVDPVILRLLWLVILIATGILPGVIVYLAAIFIVPEHHTRGNAPVSPAGA